MNRLSKQEPGCRWFAAALVLMLLPATALSAAQSKQPSAIALPAGGSTIAASLACTPTSGTLPLNIHISSAVYNQTAAERFCFGRVDMQTAGGLYLASISAGTLSLPAGVGEFVQVGWFKPMPDRFNYVGSNRYIFIVTDISAPPYNQPPYPPSGGTATATCVVEGSIP